MYVLSGQSTHRTSNATGLRGEVRQRTNGGQTTERLERLRLLQLAACLLLFLAVLVGKGVFPDRLCQVQDDILKLISADTDFRATFSALGESLAGAEALDEFFVDVFGIAGKTKQASEIPVFQITRLITRESRFYSQKPNRDALIEHFFQSGGGNYAAHLFEPSDAVDAIPSQPEPEQAAVPAVGVVILKSDYNGQPLPDHYTMDQLSLGELETITPVLGHINSDYGYRDHPINGKYQFHGGVDIGAQTGETIRAFAAGTVEYVGEDTSYGLYLQVDHGNGIKSFYAHCSAICVAKGQIVALGEKIAEVGSSGSATGPHLHLELRCGDLRVNPAYYVECLSDQ